MLVKSNNISCADSTNVTNTACPHPHSQLFLHTAMQDTQWTTYKTCWHKYIYIYTYLFIYCSTKLIVIAQSTAQGHLRVFTSSNIAQLEYNYKTCTLHKHQGSRWLWVTLRQLTHKTYFTSVIRKMRTAEPILELALACLFAIFVSGTPEKAGRPTMPPKSQCEKTNRPIRKQ